MQVETLDSQIVAGFMKLMSSELKRKVLVIEEVQAKRAPDVDWKTDRPHYLRYLLKQRRTRVGHWQKKKKTS